MFKILLSVIIFCIGFVGWSFIGFVATELGSTYGKLGSALAGIFILLLCVVLVRKLLSSWKNTLILTVLLIVGGASVMVAVEMLSKKSVVLGPAPTSRAVYQIHIIKRGAYGPSQQQEADPVMKAGDRAEITIKISSKTYQATVEVLDMSAEGSYSAVFKVTTPTEAMTISSGHVATTERIDGIDDSWLDVRTSAPIENGAAPVHFNVQVNTGDE
jgi:hypothetical protein